MNKEDDERLQEYERLQESIEIEDIAMKIEELSKIVKKIKAQINESTKTIVNKKDIAEKEIKQNPIPFMTITFLGGLFVGYIMKKITCEK